MSKQITEQQYYEIRADFSNKVRFYENEYSTELKYYAHEPDTFDLSTTYSEIAREQIECEIYNVKACNELIAERLAKDEDSDNSRIIRNKKNAQSRKSKYVRKLKESLRKEDKEIVYALKFQSL